ncbi:putative enoyl-coa hydratase/isomerase family protein [Nocardioides baekrokdamisoli]|uniref:Putative enoyl-coa hydratase/isomerase family protein n=1 Tax=Nocardioides baekrokdamisoli TaxID=1804624 RepID=A0A3G9IE79_9ACTN|nr:enoyl-CoA hydratase/isomerase family protein [Nocardioides baekrokdamisoli]BBH17280.1 putative enoyl-coa hydratase/isomerase family protein [Nocardioides baekrokdamisoli]
MSTPSLLPREGAYVLTLGDDENRFSPEWLDAADAALDQVVAEPLPLVVTGEGKFFSNGLDLDWLLTHADEATWYVGRVQGLLARLLVMPVPTVAAINGHAFGAGAMLAMACDWRFMREDRGFFCFPEADIRIPFTPGMAALIQAKVSPRTALDSMSTGHRYGGAEAEAVGIVDDVAAEADLVASALARVVPLGDKDPATIAAIKAQMYDVAVARLAQPGGVTLPQS